MGQQRTKSAKAKKELLSPGGTDAFVCYLCKESS